MSLIFTSGFSKPSAILDKPGSIERPAFDTLYGFDAPQEEVGIDGVLLTEPLGEPLITEPAGDPIAFEPT